MRAVDASTEAFTNMLMGAESRERTGRTGKSVPWRLAYSSSPPNPDAIPLVPRSKRAEEH